MATEAMRGVLRLFRRAVGPADGATDGQLLERFQAGHDEAAFATLLHRHGPMVWGVCRRLLARPEDAEDAFQATFLVLLRKGRSVLGRECLAGWLHHVARHVALKAREAALRRGTRERQVDLLPEAETPTRDGWDDLRPVLDEEVGRLPDRYRVVLVLSDLEGMTRAEAARQLGCPEGTIAGQLARARAMLAKRLTRRGITLSATALPVAGVPAAVASSTLRVAGLVAAGQAAAISSTVTGLTEGMVQAMLVTKLKIAAAVLVVILAGVGGGAALLPAAGPPAVAEAEADDTEKPKKAEAAFPGEWKWAAGQTGGMIRLKISQEKDGWVIQAWGQTRGGENDLGTTALTLLRDYEAKGDTDAEKTMNKYGLAIWDHKFAKRYVTLRAEGDKLVVEAYTVFTDKGRPNSRSRYEFTKK